MLYALASVVMVLLLVRTGRTAQRDNAEKRSPGGKIQQLWVTGQKASQ
jgi:hypothetical protein